VIFFALSFLDIHLLSVPLTCSNTPAAHHCKIEGGLLTVDSRTKCMTRGPHEKEGRRRRCKIPLEAEPSAFGALLSLSST
jgi:hypothetical protein